MSDLNIRRRDSSYKKCFWGLIHIETGTQIVSGAAILLHVFAVIGFLLRNNESFLDYLDVIRIVLGLSAFIVVFVGIHLLKPRFLAACLLLLGVRSLYYLGWTFLTVTSFFPDSPLGYFYNEFMPPPSARRYHDEGIKVTPERYLVRYAAMFLLYLWLFGLVYKCYKYISVKAAEKEVGLPQSNVATISVTEEGKTHV